MDIFLVIIELERMMVMIKMLQEKINQTEYWDLKILDLNANDEVNIFVYNDDDTSWKISFLSCFRVTYETDSTWRTIIHVREI